MSDMQEMEPGQMPQVPIGPVPVLVLPNPVEIEHGKWAVQLYVTTPQGIQIFFINPEYAEKLGEALKDCSQVARTGLVIPGTGPKDIRSSEA